MSRPIMVVESLWKQPRKPMTPEQEREYEHWCNEIHIPDLLEGTGMSSVTRYKNQDGSGYLWIQEFESEAALQKYLVSERRNGTKRLYRARPEGLFELKAFLEEFWDERLEALKREAESEERKGHGNDS